MAPARERICKRTVLVKTLTSERLLARLRLRAPSHNPVPHTRNLTRFVTTWALTEYSFYLYPANACRTEAARFSLGARPTELQRISLISIWVVSLFVDPNYIIFLSLLAVRSFWARMFDQSTTEAAKLPGRGPIIRVTC